ncbi:MAG: S1/P1 nuclease [Cyclobacteriaceae bacterium]
MKKLTIVILLVLIASEAMSWGQTGHRVVGLIAEKHLTKKAKKTICEILQNESLAEVSNFMDFIKSDPSYRHMSPWHYTTIPDGMTYEEAGTSEKGDIIVTIDRLISELKSKKFSDEDEAFALKCLVHLIGDIHQPLHVGNGDDSGGNQVKLEYFWKSSNLHRVWDLGMIDGTRYSYTEYTNWINHASNSQVEKWQSQTTLDWAYESQAARSQVYDFPEDKKLSYRYDYDNRALLNQRLLQAGIRLAGVLNEIYD